MTPRSVFRPIGGKKQNRIVLVEQEERGPLRDKQRGRENHTANQLPRVRGQGIGLGDAKKKVERCLGVI